MPTTWEASVPNVGGHSDASTIPSLPARACAHVDQATAAAEGRHDQLDRLGNVRDLPLDCERNELVLGVDQAEHLLHGEHVQVTRDGIALLGEEPCKGIELFKGHVAITDIKLEFHDHQALVLQADLFTAGKDQRRDGDDRSGYLLLLRAGPLQPDLPPSTQPAMAWSDDALLVRLSGAGSPSLSLPSKEASTSEPAPQAEQPHGLQQHQTQR